MKKLINLILFVFILMFTSNIFAFELKNENLYILYNSTKISNEDKKAINDYTLLLNDKNVTLFDVNNKTIKEIYNDLSLINKKNKIDAIQILGIESDVPSFMINEKVDFLYQTTYEPNIKVDYFYNNLNNKYEQIEQFNTSDYYNGKLNINLNPEIKVVRLPITFGNYNFYLSKFIKYIEIDNNHKLISIYKNLAYDGLNKRFGKDIKKYYNEDLHPLNINYVFKDILKIKDSELYGSNLFSSEILKRKNKDVYNYIFSYHGGKNGIQSLVNKDNHMQLLDQNYYNIVFTSCNIAKDIDSSSMLYEIMSKGKNIYSIAHTSFFYLGDYYKYNDLKSLKDSGYFYYFYYEYYNNLYNKQMNNTKSFFEAQKSYYQNLNIQKGIQYSLANLISCHHFGLIEP